MKKTTICKDCNVPFNQSDFTNWTKCTHCRERDQMYKERGIQERMGYDDAS